MSHYEAKHTNTDIVWLRLQVQNLGCYSVSNLELRLHLPSVAAGDRVFTAVTDVFSYNVSLNPVSAFSNLFLPQPQPDIDSLTALQATGVNCSVLSDLAQLKSRQRDVRPLHPEDMIQNDILVSPPAPLLPHKSTATIFISMLWFPHWGACPPRGAISWRWRRKKKYR